VSAAAASAAAAAAAIAARLNGFIKPEPAKNTVTDEDLWDQLEAAEEDPPKAEDPLKQKLETFKLAHVQKQDPQKDAARLAAEARAVRAAKAEAEAQKRQQEMQAAAFQDDIDPLDAFMAQEVSTQAQKDKASAAAKWEDESKRRARGEKVEEKVNPLHLIFEHSQARAHKSTCFSTLIFRYSMIVVAPSLVIPNF
jgi:hypothetical protein